MHLLAQGLHRLTSGGTDGLRRVKPAAQRNGVSCRLADGWRQSFRRAAGASNGGRRLGGAGRGAGQWAGWPRGTGRCAAAPGDARRHALPEERGRVAVPLLRAGGAVALALQLVVPLQAPAPPDKQAQQDDAGNHRRGHPGKAGRAAVCLASTGARAVPAESRGRLQSVHGTGGARACVHMCGCGCGRGRRLVDKERAGPTYEQVQAASHSSPRHEAGFWAYLTLLEEDPSTTRSNLIRST